MALATGFPSYVIKNSLGYVFGINTDYMICQHCDWVNDAKTFKSTKSAQKYIDKWTKSGVGLVAEDCEIIPKTF